MAGYFKRSYEDFEPYCQWQREKERDILEVHLQGFKKEHLRVQINDGGILTISGEQSLDNAKISRFRKEIKVSIDYKKDQIRAKFVGGILYLTLPKASSESPGGTTEKSQVKESDKGKSQTSSKDQNGVLCGSESIRRRTSCSRDGMLRIEINRNIALSVAVVVSVGILVGGFLIWKCTPKPAPLIY